MAAEDAAVATPPPASPFEQVLENIRNLSQRQKLAAGAALAFGIALIVGVILWSRQPDYAVLFSNLAEKDGGAAVASLQQQNIPYKFSDNGNAIGPMTGATRPVWPEAAAFSSTNCFLIYDAC